jgi:hypothetical protein
LAQIPHWLAKVTLLREQQNLKSIYDFQASKKAGNLEHFYFDFLFKWKFSMTHAPQISGLSTTLKPKQQCSGLGFKLTIHLTSQVITLLTHTIFS